MSDHDTALAELDRIGRQAAVALRAAAQQVTAPAAPATPVAGTGPAADADADLTPTDLTRTDLTPTGLNGADLDGHTDAVLFELPPASDGDHAGRTPARWPRLALAAAAVSALIGVGVVNATRDDDRSLAESTVGAPSAAFGDGSGGIYPPDAENRGVWLASPEHTEVWDQWQITVTPAGQHMLLDLTSEDGTVVTSVLGDLGAEPLQVARVDAADTLPGADETALFGIVDAAVMGAGTGGGTVTVERPGAEPVEMYVEPVEGATHNAFVGFVPGDLGADAEVVARGPDGQEISRVPVPPADDGAGDPGAAEGSIFPDDPDHPTVQVGGGQGTGNDEISWGGRVLEGGRYVELGAVGNEDSITTMIDRPASHALQVLATRLDGYPDRPVVVVYGLVEAGATTVELTAPGTDPVPLELDPIDGATHQAFGAIVPPDVDEGAVVVARDADGREIGRRPLAWTQLDAARPGR